MHGNWCIAMCEASLCIWSIYFSKISNTGAMWHTQFLKWFVAIAFQSKLLAEIYFASNLQDIFHQNTLTFMWQTLSENQQHWGVQFLKWFAAIAYPLFFFVLFFWRWNTNIKMTVDGSARVGLRGLACLHVVASFHFWTKFYSYPDLSLSNKMPNIQVFHYVGHYTYVAVDLVGSFWPLCRLPVFVMGMAAGLIRQRCDGEPNQLLTLPNGHRWFSPLQDIFWKEDGTAVVEWKRSVHLCSLLIVSVPLFSLFSLPNLSFFPRLGLLANVLFVLPQLIVITGFTW